MRFVQTKALSAVLALVLGIGIGAAVGVSPTTVPVPAATTASAQPVAPEGRALLDQFSQSFQQAAQQVNPAVVAILSEQQVQEIAFPSNPFFRIPGMRMPGMEQPETRKAHGLGSGVIVSADGYILTNDHVVKNASKLTVEVDGKKHSAQVVGTDPQTDLAVVKIDAQNLPVANLGDSDAIHVGQWVIAVGNPLELRHSVTAGIVSATGRSSVGLAAYEDFIQTDASINPGNSGGALADLDGRVVGINTAIASPNGGNIGIGFAIPINMARRVMSELMENGRMSRGYLGLSPQDLDDEMASALGVESGQGALVGDVVADGPAERAGVNRGDIIVSFNGQKVEDAAQLRKLVAETEPGSEGKLVVLRDGERQKLSVHLGERPDSGEARVEPGSKEDPAGHKLGLSIQPLTEELAQRLGYEKAHGALVAEVQPGSPAEEAGIEPGDLIVAVGRTDVRSAEDLRRALSKVHEGSDVALLVRRGESTRYVAVDLS